MRLLLDSHAWIWFTTNDPQLPAPVRSRIPDPDNFRYISIASLWEVAIKYSMGKLNLNTDLKKIFHLVKQSGIEVLPIDLQDILVLRSDHDCTSNT
ncbi:MAG: type II toxin-antitoxin system VapC family toxin [Chitinophagales bacterium]